MVLRGRIGEAAAGGVDLHALEAGLRAHAHRPLRVGAFSAASNVTGILSDVDAITAWCPRRLGASVGGARFAVGWPKMAMRGWRPHAAPARAQERTIGTCDRWRAYAFGSCRWRRWRPRCSEYHPLLALLVVDLHAKEEIASAICHLHASRREPKTRPQRMPRRRLRAPSACSHPFGILAAVVAPQGFLFHDARLGDKVARLAARLGCRRVRVAVRGQDRLAQIVLDGGERAARGQSALTSGHSPKAVCDCRSRPSSLARM